jgi:hypothetical protein
MIELVPMTAEENEDYLEQMVPDYAREHVEAEGAEERARKEMEEVYLPKGVETENQFLFTLVEGVTTITKTCIPGC